ncbi:MAG: hypothetical protein QG625_3123 [Cyanobacteriota bacterium erpe_2018_sw_39hr_WHONDRS-SW48-000098_B_bin.30]|jgi:hypothetical protein|nr:hypothetical protein [Candidatus Obscuribacter sp.]MDQ5966967.1 hypothetical protein [Cyanobacteriota bacterium erpe_2018_sw_39hr_WHONDRS-SW48-000098_B_bin.30]
MKQHEFEEPAKAALADNNVAAHGKWLEDLATPQKVNFDQSKSGDAGAIKMAQAGNVPDEPEEETEAHEAGAQKSIAEQLLAEDPKNLGQGLKTMQGLTEQFASSPDKAKALTQLRDGFEGAVKQTDQDFEAVKKNFESERNKIKPVLEPKLEAQAKAEKAFGDVFGKLPEPEQKRMQWLLTGYKNGANSKEFDAAIAKEVGKHPGLMQSFNNLNKSTKELEPLVEQVKKLKEGLDNAASERAAGRMVYSQVLTMGGDQERAKRMELEGRALIMGVPLSQVDELEKRMKKP